MALSHIYLVPGFFGFDTLGSFDYFRGVASVLRTKLRGLGVRSRVFECAPQPTAFVKYRAEQVAQRVVETGGLNASELHFVGHSTGALDVRQLLSPHGGQRDPERAAAIGRRTRSAVLLSGPNRGTPLAHFFDAINARSALRVLAGNASSRGRAAIVLAAKGLDVATRANTLIGRRHSVLGTLSGRLLRHITLDPNDRVWVWLQQVAADQGAILLLTTEWMEHFNATVADREGVAYSSVVTAAPTPLQDGILALLRRHPVSLNLAYLMLHSLVALTPAALPETSTSPEDLAVIRAAFPWQIDEQTNDGIVPTLRQSHGRLLGAFVADHMDTVGQFSRPGSDPYADWLVSGSGFDEISFSTLWGRIAEEIAAHSTQRH